MSDYEGLGGIIKRLREMRLALQIDRVVCHTAADAIESLLAEKASARDGALEEVITWIRTRPASMWMRNTRTTAELTQNAQVAYIRALRSAKEQ